MGKQEQSNYLEIINKDSVEVFVNSDGIYNLFICIRVQGGPSRKFRVSVDKPAVFNVLDEYERKSREVPMSEFISVNPDDKNLQDCLIGILPKMPDVDKDRLLAKISNVIANELAWKIEKVFKSRKYATRNQNSGSISKKLFWAFLAVFITGAILLPLSTMIYRARIDDNVEGHMRAISSIDLAVDVINSREKSPALGIGNFGASIPKGVGAETFDRIKKETEEYDGKFSAEEKARLKVLKEEYMKLGEEIKATQEYKEYSTKYGSWISNVENPSFKIWWPASLILLVFSILFLIRKVIYAVLYSVVCDKIYLRETSVVFPVN